MDNNIFNSAFSSIYDYYTTNNLTPENDYMKTYLGQGLADEPIKESTKSKTEKIDIAKLLSETKFVNLNKVEPLPKDNTNVLNHNRLNTKPDLGELNIDNPYIKKAVEANIYKESMGIPKSEDLTYKNIKRLREVFPSKTSGKSDKELSKFIENPEELANFVYGNRMGNAKNEGWKYRGRGYIQLTGKDNYNYYGKKLNLHLVSNPDLANQPKIAMKIAEEFIKEGLKGKKIPTNQLEANRLVTQIIGGNGLNLNSGYGAKLLAKVNNYTK